MASEDLKRLVAREIASGESIADVARRHRYSWKGMKKLAETPEVRRLVAAEREQINELAEQSRAELVLLSPVALKNVRAAVESAKHPKNLEMSRFVLEKILPSRTTVEADVKLNDPFLRNPQLQAEIRQITAGAAEFLRSLGDLPQALAEPGQDPHVLTAEQALPSAISAVDAQECSEEVADSGNGAERQAPPGASVDRDVPISSYYGRRGR